MSEYSWADDAYQSWMLGLATMRELAIRRGHIKPRKNNPDERRWSQEGERAVAELDTVRQP